MVFEVYVICIFTIFRYSVRNSDTMNHALLAKKKCSSNNSNNSISNSNFNFLNVFNQMKKPLI